MKNKNRSGLLNKILAVFVIFSLSGQSVASAQAPQQQDKQRIGYNEATGKVSFIGADPSRPIAIRGAQTQGLQQDSRALAMVSAYATDFGLRNPVSELKLLETEQVEGREVTRFQQVHQGIPIMGGEIIVNANDRAELLSLSGEISPDLALDVNPTISAKQAQITALELMAKSYQVSMDEFEATTPALWIYDSRLFEPDGTKAALVWRLEVKSIGDSLPVNELVLVDAKRGNIVLNFNQIDTAWAADEDDPTATTTPIETVTPEPEVSATPIPSIDKPTPPADEDPRSQQQALGVTYYVDIATGNDSNSCTSSAAPCQHIQETINKAGSGDTILIKEGTYYTSIQITKALTLSGGWDDTYSSQPGTSILDAQGAVATVLYIGSDANIDLLQMKNGFTGVWINPSINVTLRRSSVYGMSYWGIHNRGNLNLENTTISGNQNSGIDNFQGTVNILNSTITDNSSSGNPATGGIRSTSGTVNIQNSILASNTKDGNPADCYGGITSLGNNLIGTMSGCTITPLLSDIVGANPQVSTFLGSGYHALFSNSPAIDAANSGACPALDQRGVTRPEGITCDIGSYEYTVVGSAAKIIVQTGESQVGGLNILLNTPLKALVLDSLGSPVSGKTVTFTAPISGPSGVFSDNGTNQTTAITDVNGIASAPPFTTNLISGTYNITASTTGVAVNANFAVANTALYVKPDGDNNLNCTSPATACATINGALGKAPSNASILVAGGVYTGSGYYVVTVSKNISLSGGWNASFSAQDSQSIIDGQNSRDGIYISPGPYSDYIVNIEHFTIKNSFKGINNSQGNVVNLLQSALLNNFEGASNLGILKIINVTTSYNSLNGISNHHTLTIQNSTITNNAGGIYSGSYALATTNIQNSILAENITLGQAANCKINAGSITSNGYNIIGPTSGCTIATQATDLIGVNPWLSPSLNDGSYALYANSPAINTANAATCPSTDQRNVVRPIGAGCDIGSVEYPGPGAVPAYIFTYTGSPQLILLNSAASPALKAVVLDENGGGVSGITVTFTAPSSGASGIFLDTNAVTSTAITDANGIATPSTFYANNVFGSYIVEAKVAGLTNSANFQLSNGVEIRTYTANNSTILPGTFLCDHTNPLCTYGSNADADRAHQFAFGVYQFYNDKHNRHSMDNNNMPIISSVRYGSGYQNANWTGTQMIYGNGYSTADDIVGHEFTHGVTQYESNLFYYYQSGAINESFSDVWGELYDQQNGLGSDTVGVKWLIAEDIPGGALRSMSNPPAYGDPDKITNANYYTGALDNGGVHTNSGVNNKAAFLMVDGGSFNGKTVTALGVNKTLAIYYEVQTNLLVSGADYSDLYYALYQGCLNLVGGASGIVSGDCEQVRSAADAVQMNLQPVVNFNTDAPMCTVPGQVPNDIFHDDLESGTSNWTIVNGANTRWQYDSPYGDYAHSGEHFLYANDWPAAATNAFIKLNPITVPVNGYLHFAHAYDFEKYTNDPKYYDGGVLEYSMNNGASWVDAGSLIDFNGYKGVIAGGYSNPLQGRLAYAGSSHGYISTRLNLSALAGQSVSFRWRMGLDTSGYYWGWWLDDVRIYNCIELNPNVSVSIGEGDMGSYNIPDQTARRFTYAGFSGGPVQVVNTESQPVVSSLRLLYNNKTFSELMGVPTDQLSNDYWLPYYANISGTDTQIRFTNTDPTLSTTVNVYLGDNPTPVYTKVLAASSTDRINLPSGTTGGPVHIVGTGGINILAGMRVIYGGNKSFDELMAFPTAQLDTEYWFPFYNHNNVNLDTQVRVANTSSTDSAPVDIYIGDTLMDTTTIAPLSAYLKSFPGVNGGPVRVVSTSGTPVPIVASLRLLYNNKTFSELMGVPTSQLSNDYWLPYYANISGTDTQLRFTNTDPTLSTTVNIYLGDNPTPVYTKTLLPKTADRINLPSGTTGGPVHIVGTGGVNILAGMRVIYGGNSSFDELSAYPTALLSAEYWFPFYNHNNVNLDTEARIGVP